MHQYNTEYGYLGQCLPKTLHQNRMGFNIVSSPALNVNVDLMTVCIISLMFHIQSAPELLEFI